MNFEHLYKTILLNQNKLKNKKAAKRFLTYHYELLNIKKNKLKLGAVTFDLIQTMFEGFLLKQTVEMRYTRQDTSAADELKFENHLKALRWKWDYANVLALLIITIFLIILLIAMVYVWYCNNLSEFAFQDAKYNTLVDRTFRLVFTPSSSALLKLMGLSNLFLIDSIINLCIFFNVFF